MNKKNNLKNKVVISFIIVFLTLTVIGVSIYQFMDIELANTWWMAVFFLLIIGVPYLVWKNNKDL